jgi:predicted DNA-binding transcriptional regulator AlpA
MMTNTDTKPVLRKILRRKALLAATGWSTSTLYDKISKGIFPPPVKLDPDGDGRAVGWFEDVVIAHQMRLEAARDAKAGNKTVA